ncbi:alpha-1,2-fucosyltransferase [Salmonirosea aquatica]|uniref:Alpha-1,2-fucosyltransferase n=1 Tax=Salmonirosea aquatica TaxID=2654236 RepID=A0A7C9BH65_9BACT|nr:alpha-1,2-fucosyltransferase [Cytophagaceae bacterium SJW1-29]
MVAFGLPSKHDHRKITGGLGNQLFQYATARAVAHHHETSVAFDLHSFQNHTIDPDTTPRAYELAALGISAVQPSLFDGLALGIRAVPYQSRLQKLVRRWRRITEYREIHMGYDPAILKKTTANTYLIGYFQSELYFENIQSILRKELKFISNPDSDLTGFPNSSNPVSLHIRRGDYVTNARARQLHGLCSLDYYQKAATYLANRLGEIHLFVFSDDQAWARKNLSLPYPITFVEKHEGRNSFYDMYLMSQCKHHIIANSSFSWWGAWLNPSHNKIVVAPSRWLAHEVQANESADRIPLGWVRI